MSTQNSEKLDRSTLLKEAILDAKMVKAVALANAKLVVEEQFTPRLQSMLSKKIQQEVEGADDEQSPDVDDVPTEPPQVAQPEPTIATNTPVVQPEPTTQDTQQATAQPASVPVAPVAPVQQDATSTASVAPVAQTEQPEEVPVTEIPGEQGEQPANSQPETNPESLDDEGEEIDVDALIKELSADSPTESAVKSGPITTQDGQSDEDEEINLEELFKEETPEVSGTPVTETSKIPNGEISDEEIDKIIQEINALKTESDSCENKEGEENEEEHDKDDDSEVVALKEENISLTKKLNEAFDTVQYLRDRINEINVLNSKLLYTNKLFKEHTLNVNQKEKVFEAFDRSQSVRETKLIFNTLCESFKSGKAVTTPQRKLTSVTATITEGLASKPIASTKPTKPEVITENVAQTELRNRLMQLAGISSKQR